MGREATDRSREARALGIRVAKGSGEGHVPGDTPLLHGNPPKAQATTQPKEHDKPAPSPVYPDFVHHKCLGVCPFIQNSGSRRFGPESASFVGAPGFPRKGSNPSKRSPPPPDGDEAGPPSICRGPKARPEARRADVAACGAPEERGGPETTKRGVRVNGG